jgi:hypothetical protein
LEHVLRQLLHVPLYLLLLLDLCLALYLLLLLAWLLASAAAGGVVGAGLGGCLLPSQLGCKVCCGKHQISVGDGCKWHMCQEFECYYCLPIWVELADRLANAGHVLHLLGCCARPAAAAGARLLLLVFGQ